ncbi:ankyrin repeat domain-containing protein [Luteimonas sp. MJ174]|uniref:ankyrin repeat domain-containing protein n=1 Tax=Luteimonas sp. MJ174 TaxID=3129237 RepID=UPI0031BA17B7
MDHPFTDPQLAPLADAALRGDADTLCAGLAGVNPDTPGKDGTSLLQLAVAAGQPATVAALLDAGADPNRQSPGGGGPMHAAAFGDDPTLLRALLDHGGNPDLRNSVTGETPLVRAILGRGDAQVKMLLDAGADPGAADGNGATPLHAAGSINAGAVVMLLLESGAPAHATNSAGDTFQPYYFQLSESLLTARARGERQAVIDWLRAHDVPLEAGVGE